MQRYRRQQVHDARGSSLPTRPILFIDLREAGGDAGGLLRKESADVDTDVESRAVDC